jgi:hypothetical protein
LRCRLPSHGRHVARELATTHMHTKRPLAAGKSAPLDKPVTASIGRTRAAVNAVFMNHIE